VQAKRRQRETTRRKSQDVEAARAAARGAIARRGVWVLVLTSVVVGCSGSRPAGSDRLGDQASPAAVLARVGPHSIVGGTLNRAIGAELRGEAGGESLVPPAFSACIAHLAGEAAAIGERPAGPSQLRHECQTSYRAVAQSVLDRLISDEWLIGGAEELRVPVSEEGMEESLDGYNFKTESQFRSFLAGRTPVELDSEISARLAAAAMRRAVLARIRPVTEAEIRSYYKGHRFQYLLAASRDLKIARTATEVAAAKVKAEIESGKSFASVVGKLPIRQPVNSNEGLVLELQPHTYGEPKLNEAIFAATPGVLTGPIGTSFGYFVFEVTKTRFEHVEPLAQVEASIRQQLTRPLQEQVLAAFTKQWQATWTARTDCSPGYVVPGCRQYRGSPPPESLPTIN
jgi:hypothetical protein